MTMTITTMNDTFTTDLVDLVVFVFATKLEIMFASDTLVFVFVVVEVEETTQRTPQSRRKHDTTARPHNKSNHGLEQSYEGRETVATISASTSCARWKRQLVLWNLLHERQRR